MSLKIGKQLLFAEYQCVGVVHFGQQIFRIDALNRFFPCGVDGQKDGAIQEVEGSSKLVREIAGAGVEVRLENPTNFPIRINFTDRRDEGAHP